jgi:hypothetical protein
VAQIALAPKPVTDVSQMFRAAEDQAARYAEGDTDEEASPLPPAVVQPMAAHAPLSEPVKQTESAEAGVQRAGKILSEATTARWPMYLRNVKQILRQAEGGFDERRYGFGGLMDLLKACQREGLVRIERDRRGGLRVFQGSALARPAVAPSASREILDVDVETNETQPGELFEASEPIEIEERQIEPIDTTAELLGRAKPRKPRARAPRQAAATPTPRAAAAAKAKPAKKAATPRKSRSKKAVSSQANDESES